MKKLLTLLIVFSTLLTFTGCNKEIETVENDNLNQLTAEEILGIANNNKNDQINKDDQVDKNESSLDLVIGIEDNSNANDILSNNTNLNNKNDQNINSIQLLSDIWEFRVIDCGQADSILIHSINSTILIDAGEESKATAIMKVLDNLGIKKIDIIIGTHAHADHIGGMQTIIENYDIGKIILSPQTHTTKTYENLLLAIDNKNYEVTIAEPGNVYTVDGLKLEIIGPCDEYNNDLNNSSVVAIASYKDIDILLTGDAEFQSEKDYVEYLRNKDIELLKVGHHGSDTSTSDNLLNILQPEIALISCGVNNKYGHPKAETLEKLERNNVEVYRTDLLGDIIVRTDGNEYTVETAKGEDITPNRDNNDDNNSSNNNKNNNQNAQNVKDNNDSVTQYENVVYMSKKGKKYHSTENCPALYTSREIKELSEDDAIANGLTKCSKCW